MAIQEHLWEFPHAMQLKVMGAADAPLEQALIDILSTHLDDFDAASHLTSKPSSKEPLCHLPQGHHGNREQVGNYKALNECPHVKMTI